MRHNATTSKWSQQEFIFIKWDFPKFRSNLNSCPKIVTFSQVRENTGLCTHPRAGDYQMLFCVQLHTSDHMCIQISPNERKSSDSFLKLRIHSETKFTEVTARALFNYRFSPDKINMWTHCLKIWTTQTVRVYNYFDINETEVSIKGCSNKI